MYARIALLAACAALPGCVVERTGPTEHVTRTIERGEAKSLRVNLRMGAGELRVTGGSSELAEADCTYNVPSWRPEISYSASETRGLLTIEQTGKHHGHVGNMRYEWNLRLNDEVPVEVHAEFGAGHARLNLGSLFLRSVDVNMGVGELEMDLRGNPKHDYEVRVQGGVGEATVRLPANVGVTARGTGGIGSINVRGLRKEGGRWVNDAIDSSKVQVRVDVSGGIGQINLIAE
ncbi:MAG TPA: toast rack family protein [Bryobacteraceae bacterium]|jgi:hypothetical protein